MRKQNKYYSEKIHIDGMTFDSRKEYKRYCELRLLERAKQITDLQRQVKFVLIPTQREPDTMGPRGGIHKGKVIELECAYIADFVYKENGELVVEDTKGYRRGVAYEIFVIKRKLMLQVHGIRIREI